MSIGSISVEVVPDTTNLARKINAAAAEIRDITINVDVDSGAAQAKLAALTAEAEALGSAGDGVKAKLNESTFDGANRGASKLLIAVAALSPALVPLGGAALAAGGAIGTAMGIGVLAVLGVKDAMKEGTNTGLAFKQAISTLNSDFDVLKATAASGVLAPFQQAVTRLHADLPGVNAAVADLAPLIGDAAGNFTTGFIGGLSSFQPLMHEVLSDVDNLSAKFATWATGPGGRAFADDLLQAYEEVKPLISDTADVIEKLVEVAAPLGSALVDAFDDAAKALKPVLDGLKWIEDNTPKGLGLGNNSGFGAINDLGQGRGSSNPLIVGHPVDSAGLAPLSAAPAVAAETDAQQKLAAALGITAASYTTASDAASKHASTVANDTVKLQLEGDAVGLLSQAFDALNGRFLSYGQAQTQYGSTLQHTLATLNQYTASTDQNTEAGTANRSAIESLVSSAQNYASAATKSALATHTAADAQTIGEQKYKALAAQILDNISKTDGADSATYKYAKQLLGLNDIHVNPVVLTVQDLASEPISKVRKAIQDLNGTTATVVVNTINTGGGNPYAGGQAGLNKAVGGYITGPGTSTSDSVPANLSNGEFVVNAAAVAQFRPLLEQINNGVDVRVPTVFVAQSSTSSVGSPSGPAVFHLYDASGALLGTMRGIATDAVRSESAELGRYGQ